MSIFDIFIINENCVKKMGVMVFNTTFNNISVILWWLKVKVILNVFSVNIN